MAKVRHRDGVRGSPAVVYAALIEPTHLRNWWATSATGTPKVGNILDLSFGELGTISFVIRKLESSVLVELECSSGPPPWIGSRLQFVLESTEEQTFLILTHEHENADQESFLYFNTKWPLYMLSLRDYIETGSGRPYPNDIKIHYGD